MRTVQAREFYKIHEWDSGVDLSVGSLTDTGIG